MSHAHAESRILIVEDAPANIQAPTAVLRDEGYLLHVATNGRQAALPATPINEDGDSYTMDGRDFLIQIAPTTANAAAQYMLRGTVPAPDWEVALYHGFLRSFAALWKQAG